MFVLLLASCDTNRLYLNKIQNHLIFSLKGLFYQQVGSGSGITDDSVEPFELKPLQEWSEGMR